MRTFEVQYPKYHKTGDKFTGPDGQVLEWCEAEMHTRGVVQASDEIEAMKAANRRFVTGYWAKCYSWVLSEIRGIH